MANDETVRVYVAGPLFGSGRSTENVYNTLKVAELVIEAGGVPFVPHLFHLWDTVSPHEAAFWLRMDKAWLQKCDLLLVIPGVSPGTRMEEGWAKEFEIPQADLSLCPDKQCQEPVICEGTITDRMFYVERRIASLREAKKNPPQIVNTPTGPQQVRPLPGLRIEQLVALSYRTAKEHGWWNSWPVTMTMRRQESSGIAEKIALTHSELSEALEEVRKPAEENHGLGMYYLTRNDTGGVIRTTTPANNTKPEGFVVELADVIIRIADLCGALNLDLEGAIQAKMAYNETRPYKHGGKTI